jgi:membrane protein DedA with SNARE-associated domain
MADVAALLAYILGDSSLYLAGLWLSLTFLLSLRQALRERDDEPT